MDYFTSDLHFGHQNIIRHCGRPFFFFFEMDRALIRNWNQRVNSEDTVYILGDLFFTSKSPIEEILSALKGKKHLVLGNHDPNWIKKIPLSRYFETVSLMAQIKSGGRRLTLCHYPLMTWREPGEKSLLLYGHIHNNKKDVYWPLLSQMSFALNVSVEINGYQPVTVEELIENNRIWKEEKESKGS